LEIIGVLDFSFDILDKGEYSLQFSFILIEILNKKVLGSFILIFLGFSA
jgi:hypothetical protein